jgi:hypothetical protein
MTGSVIDIGGKFTTSVTDVNVDLLNCKYSIKVFREKKILVAPMELSVALEEID